MGPLFPYETDRPQYKLRIPESLKLKIEESAKGSRRSMNAEIVARLAETYEIESSLQESYPGAELPMAAFVLREMNNSIHSLNLEILELKDRIESLIQEGVDESEHTIQRRTMANLRAAAKAAQEGKSEGVGDLLGREEKLRFSPG
ncbi:Arc family DNA-binding protein [Pseudomonas aeruginosa]